MRFDASGTIYARSTPEGKGAVALLRLSGERAFSVARSLIGQDLPPPRLAKRVKLSNPSSREVLDQALLLCFLGPASYTGEDLVELHLHGSEAVVTAVLEVLGAQEGCRLAQPGEFSWRAFMNGKMDLPQLEGLADLIEARSQAQRRLAQQSGADLSEQLLNWRDALLALEVGLEAQIDFPDEDLDASAFANWETQRQALIAEMQTALSTRRAAKWVREGLRLVIAGAPNVGKSSLLNAFAGEEAAIVSPLEGTTRDSIEIRLWIQGVEVRIRDTAGLRESQDLIEQEGMRRAHQHIREADLVLGLHDLARPETRHLLTNLEAQRLWRVANKADLVSAEPHATEPDTYRLALLNGAGFQDLLRGLGDFLLKELAPLENALALGRARQVEALERICASLEMAGDTHLPELKAEQVRASLGELDRLLGLRDPDAMLSALFSQFCIGK